MYYFGKPITLQQANSQVKEFLMLKNSSNTYELLSTLADSKAARYYSGGELSFVFEGEIIDQMFKTPFCNGMRIYLACLNESEQRVMKEGLEPVTLPAGTPTLVVVPCNILPDGSVRNLVQENEQSLVACEHPGLLAFTNSIDTFDLRTDQ